ncbi:unnamed protein product [Dibothriocephalus latus]|uniref:Uncharacterized protein n=1 Tax=Dibothriocephalus latus TaxID=60516 RepID=A0A3P6SWG8_DIBLA|nr:unnamed protein product [Dibothriocephalus latus]
MFPMNGVMGTTVEALLVTCLAWTTVGYGGQRLQVSPMETEIDLLDNPYTSEDLVEAERQYGLPPLGYPDRPKKFESREEKENYVAALNTYFMLFGRPRFVPPKILITA